MEELKKYKQIIVTGPQRSGTRICSKIIVDSTGHNYIDEDDYKVSNRKMLKEILDNKENIVVQGPAISAWIEEIATEEMLVVFMRRKISDIVASQNRINWGEKGEKNKYESKFGEQKGKVSEIKYRIWEEKQRGKIENWKEIQYSSLKNHKLWIPKRKRTNFQPNQTEL